MNDHLKLSLTFYGKCASKYANLSGSVTEIIDAEERERHLVLLRPHWLKIQSFSSATSPFYIRRSV